MTAALPNGKVLIAGGTDSFYATDALASAEVYNPATGSWTATGSMTRPRVLAGTVLLPSNVLLIIGGMNKDGIMTDAERYNP